MWASPFVSATETGLVRPITSIGPVSGVLTIYCTTLKALYIHLERVRKVLNPIHGLECLDTLNHVLCQIS